MSIPCPRAGLDIVTAQSRVGRALSARKMIGVSYPGAGALTRLWSRRSSALGDLDMIAGFDLAGLMQVPSRQELWTRVITESQAKMIAEVGVYQGEFAEAMLRSCPGITTYYMIDPWRHLDDWNKPANKRDSRFQVFFDKVMTRTALWESKRVVLRGRTVEVVDYIPDDSLDLAYVDGDHTLRGISIDLIRMWQKIRPGGMLGGDDLSLTIWQHNQKFEPSLVFPFAVYFAEAVGAPIAALPHDQFLIHKVDTGFVFHDPSGQYHDATLRAALAAPPVEDRDEPQPHPGPESTSGLVRRLQRKFRNRE